MTRSSNIPTIPAGFEDLRGHVFHERYSIAELLDASTHRVAFSGTEQAGGRPIVLVQVKPAVLHDAATRTRFERRVRAWARVRHAAIAGPIDSGETLDGKLWLVFERPAGESLDRCLAGLPSGRIEWAAARPLLLELVRGLEAAHTRGVVHGSVCPACCWVHGVGSDAPVLRLLDAGANTDPAADEAEVSYSRTTTLGGDPVFMAPEAAGGIFGDERSDAYLVGLVAYTMLVGRPPFQAANAFQLVTMHLQAPVPPMREAGADASEAVEAWVRALLAKEPAQRPASMTEVEKGLLAIDEHGSPRQGGAAELEKPRGRRGRARASQTSRDDVVEQLGEREPAPAQGLSRRLPGQEIVDPRAAFAPAMSVASPPSPAVLIEPVAAEGDDLAQTLAFGAIRSAMPASEEPVGTAVLTMPRDARPVSASEEPAGTAVIAMPRADRGALRPDATMKLGAELGGASSEMPDATIMLSGAELSMGGALQPSTMVLGPEPARGGPPADAPTATVALTVDATMLARGANFGPGHAPTTLLSGDVAAGGGQGATTVLGGGVPGLEPREAVPMQRGLQVPSMVPTASSVVAPPPAAFVPRDPPAGALVPRPPRAVMPEPTRSRLGLWVVIMTVVAAVAGVAVGLVLGG